MAKLPVFFTASTKAIAEKAIQRGILKYPGLCYIEDGNVIAWMTEDNEIRYTKGDKQITDVRFSGSNLQFFNEKKLLFSYDLSMTDEDKDHIVDEVKRQIGLDSYIKSSELSTILDNIIGNLEDKQTVVDYINSLSYRKLTDKPIEYLIGSLTVPVTISTLDDGIYKIKGQFIIGGNSTTVHSSADEVFFLVSHDEDTHGTSITQFQGKASNGLNLRYKPGDTSNSNLILTIPNGKSVANYGYYTAVNGVKWYLVTYKDTPGFVSSRYLVK